MPGFAIPGDPNTSGGNRPAVVAAMGNIRQGAMNQQAAAPPNQQMPQGGGDFGARLFGILQEYVQAGAPSEMTEQIRQFFESFVEIAAETQRGIESQAAPPGGMMPAGQSQGLAQAAPQPMSASAPLSR